MPKRAVVNYVATSDLSSKADVAGDTFTGPIIGTDITLSGDLAVSGVSMGSKTSITPSGSTATLDLDTYQHIEVNMTSGSGLCTLTLHHPANASQGQLVFNHHGTTVRDLSFVSTAPINFVGTEPDWITLAAGSTTVVAYYFDGSEFYLSAIGTLVLGTTTGTAYDGGSGATLASSVSSLTTSVSGKITNGNQLFAGGGTAVVSSAQSGSTPNFANAFTLQMGGTGTFTGIGVLTVGPSSCAMGYASNNVAMTTTATTFTDASLWRAGLSVLALAGGQLTGSVRHTEVTSTPSGTTQAITLNSGNHQTLSLTSASGNVTATLTVPSSSSAGTIIVKQHASAQKDITWAVSSGSIKWMGTEPDWVSDAVNAVRVVSWRWDGSVMYLASTEVGT